MHGRLAIISLRPDISRVDYPVLHARTMNDAIFSMIDGALGASAHAHSLFRGFVGACEKCSRRGTALL